MKFLFITMIFLSLVSFMFAGEEISINKPKMIEFGSKKCIPCKMMEPVLEKLREEYPFMVVEFVDVWLKENREAGKKYKIESIPTQVFEDPQGKELFRHTGFFSLEEILDKWKELGYPSEKVMIPEQPSCEKKVAEECPSCECVEEK